MTVAYSRSILLIGATSASGIQITNQLLTHPASPQVHLFCQDSSKVSAEHRKLCDSIYEGDACSATDIEVALAQTKADLIIIAIGARDSVAKSRVRTVNAQVVANAMTKPGFRHVRAVVLSSIGAGPSSIKAGFGMGVLLAYYLRHVLKDHTGQESAFLDNGLANRTVIVRATALTDGNPNGDIEEFGDHIGPSTIFVDRGDIAMYMAREACNGASGKIVHITGNRQNRRNLRVLYRFI